MIIVKKGSILVYRLFDVAEEIQMSKVESLLRNHRGPDLFRVPKFIERALIMKNPPISFGMGEEVIHVQGRQFKADVLVKIRDFGVISLIYQIPIDPGTDWDALRKIASDLEEGSEIDQLAIQQVKEISATISECYKKPSNWASFEDYIVYFIEEFADGIGAKDLLANADVASLLLAEDKIKIAESTRKSITENIFQYSENDLTLVEWNSALVVEPGGGRELPDILEFAVTQLMEMRYYDDLLDLKLQVLYDDIEKKRAGIWYSRFDKAYEEASSRYIEFTEFTERVENSLKVVGDFYLATVYRAATRRFRLAEWNTSVTKKVNILAQVSSLLQGEINYRRSHLMEIVIILMIAYEIALAIWKH